MTWLVVLGHGSWTHDGRRYEAGAHHVSEAVAEAARRTRSRSLVVTDDEPTLSSRRESGAPLALDDVRVNYRTTGVRLARPELEALIEGPIELPRDYVCELCPATFPSRGALVRHVEFHHP